MSSVVGDEWCIVVATSVAAVKVGACLVVATSVTVVKFGICLVVATVVPDVGEWVELGLDVLSVVVGYVAL